MADTAPSFSPKSLWKTTILFCAVDERAANSQMANRYFINDRVEIGAAAPHGHHPDFLQYKLKKYVIFTHRSLPNPNYISKKINLAQITRQHNLQPESRIF